MNVRLTVSLPEDISDTLSDLAAADGVAIGTYAKRLLMAHVLGTDTRATPSTRPPWEGPAPTPAQWTALNLWMAANPLTPMPDDWPRKRSALMAWAVSHGFQKP